MTGKTACMTGKTLGRMHDEPSTTNIAFGGDVWKTLYFTTQSTFGSVKLKTAGMPVPVKNR
jgi:sugar lactone lactonase YvrE